VAVRLADSTPQALNSTSNVGLNAHTIFVANLFMRDLVLAECGIGSR
jgi:hypothetical protein